MEDNRTDEGRPEGRRAEAGRILRLAWPIMLTSLNWTLMHLIDVAVVGHYGTAELAALGASRIVTFIVIVMGFAGLTGILVFTARADGVKQGELKVGECVQVTYDAATEDADAATATEVARSSDC